MLNDPAKWRVWRESRPERHSILCPTYVGKNLERERILVLARDIDPKQCIKNKINSGNLHTSLSFGEKQSNHSHHTLLELHGLPAVSQSALMQGLSLRLVIFSRNCLSSRLVGR